MLFEIGHAVVQLTEAMLYKPEVRGVDFPMELKNFPLK
jgi:hypothetical protein